MNARKVRLLAGGFLLLLAILLHLAGCRWGSANSLADPPFITLRDNIVVDEDYASQAKIAHEQFDKVYAALGQPPGGQNGLLGNYAPMDDETRVKYDDLSDQLHYWLDKLNEATPLAFGKYGLYPRGSRDSGLILGVVTPAIFLTGGLFMLVWAFSAVKAER